MTKTVQGTVRGNTIQLHENHGFLEGQQVRVRIEIIGDKKTWGEGLRRCAGGLADDEEWDEIMNRVYEARKLDRSPPPEVE